MKKICAVVLASALLGLPSAPIALAADKCPPEVAEAKTLLGRAAAGKRTTARGQETQAPRQLAGGKQQDVQAPRGQDVQAPKQQETQAPRGKQQDVQAPRGQDVQAPKQQETQAPRDKQQDVQAPRGQDVQAPRLGDARKLVREAEAACKKGDMALSAGKAKEAIELLK
jgi:hypothetical protein